MEGDPQLPPITSQDRVQTHHHSSFTSPDATPPITPKATQHPIESSCQLQTPQSTNQPRYQVAPPSVHSTPPAPVSRPIGSPTPVRVTLTLPNPPKRTPFDRYRKRNTTESDPSLSLDPYRFTYQKLGVSAEEFKLRAEEEVDDLLKEIDNNRRTALLETLPFERPLSKDDYLRQFNPSAQPPSGSNIGNYMWAADLGRCRFNFDFDFATDDISILNAYD